MSKISNRDIANALNIFVREDYRSALFGKQMPSFWTKQDFPVKSYKPERYCQFVMVIPYADEIIANLDSNTVGVIELNNRVLSSIEKAHVLLDHRFNELRNELYNARFHLNFELSHRILYHNLTGMSIELTCDFMRINTPACALVKYAKSLKARNLI